MFVGTLKRQVETVSTSSHGIGCLCCKHVKPDGDTWRCTHKAHKNKDVGDGTGYGSDCEEWEHDGESDLTPPVQTVTGQDGKTYPAARIPAGEMPSAKEMIDRIEGRPRRMPASEPTACMMP